MDDLKSSKNESNADSPDTETEVAEEIQNAPSLNVRPEIALYFEEIADIGFTGNLDDEQNLKGEPTTGFGGSLALTLRNPSVSGGTLWKSTKDGQSSDYKLFGSETSEVWEVQGSQVGVEYGTNNFEGEAVDDFEEDYVTLYLGGGLGEYVLTRLDIFGGVGAEPPYDEPTGVMEYAPDGSDVENAVRRQPALRADMQGRGGAIMVEVGDNNGAFLGSVFGEYETEDGGSTYSELEQIDSTENDGYLDTSELYCGDFAWADFDGEATDDSDERAANSESTDDDVEDVDDVDDLTMNFSDDDSGPTSYDDLDDAWKQFVDEIVGAVEGGQIEQSKVPTMAENFVDSNEQVEWGNFDGDTIQGIVQDQSA